MQPADCRPALVVELFERLSDQLLLFGVAFDLLESAGDRFAPVRQAELVLQAGL